MPIVTPCYNNRAPQVGIRGAMEHILASLIVSFIASRNLLGESNLSLTEGLKGYL